MVTPAPAPSPAKRPRRLRRFLRRAALALVGAVALYFLAAVVLSAIPLNPGSGRSGPVEIFVRSNGVHVDLVLPVRNERFDWGPVAPASDAADPRAAAAPWVAIGWGDRDIYRKVPTWDDLTPGLALRAGLGLDGAALHAARLFAAEEGPDCRRLALAEEQYDALVAFLLESGVRDETGRLVPLAGLEDEEPHAESAENAEPFPGEAGSPLGGAGGRSEPEGVCPAASAGASDPSEPPPEDDYEDLPPDDL